MLFKVGDRVSYPDFGIGTIVEVDEGELPFLVNFDNYNPDLHTGNGNVPDGHGWWCNAEELILEGVKEFPDIRISFNTYNGQTKASFIQPDGKSLKTRCAYLNPSDDWDSFIGATIAVARLFNKRPEWNESKGTYSMKDTVEYKEQIVPDGKYVCISKPVGFLSCLTVGKIYNILNGAIVADNGVRYDIGAAPDFKKYFLKIVE